MNANELLEEWESGEKAGMRPQRIQAVRDDLKKATGLSVPRRISRIEIWFTAMKETGTIPRRLKESSNGNKGIGKKTNDS